jgi:hypothetical protein
MQHCLPRALYADAALLRRYQWQLLARGVPLAWAIDLPVTERLFMVAQMLIVLGAIGPQSPRFHMLELAPDQPLSHADLLGLAQAVQQLHTYATSLHDLRWITPSATLATREVVEQVLQLLGVPATHLSDPPTWRDVCAAAAPRIEQALARTAT